MLVGPGLGLVFLRWWWRGEHWFDGVFLAGSSLETSLSCARGTSAGLLTLRALFLVRVSRRAWYAYTKGLIAGLVEKLVSRPALA